MTPKQQFIDAYRQESATTIKVLRAYPAGKSELKPHPLCRTARELAWIFVGEQAMCQLRSPPASTPRCLGREIRNERAG